MKTIPQAHEWCDAQDDDFWYEKHRYVAEKAYTAGYQAALLAGADALDAMTWRPIETAPKDGTWIIVYGRFHEKHKAQGAEWYLEAATYSNILDAWTNPSAIIAGADGLWNPTHWMPLPQGVEG